jgi:hypothetical protein
LPAQHLDGLDKVQFREGEWISSRTVDGNIIDAAGTYDPATKVITLSSNKDNVNVYGRNVAAHEVGHHVHMAKLTDKAATEWNKISEGGQHARISAYARTCQGEHFAEAYRAYYNGGHARAALKNLEPASYKFMASLNRSGSSSVLPAGTMAKLDWSRYK